MDHRKPMDAPDAAAMAIGSKFVWQQPGEVGGFPIGGGHPPVGIPIKRFPDISGMTLWTCIHHVLTLAPMGHT